MMPQRFDRTLAPDSSELRKGAIAPAQSAMNAAGALIATVILPAYNEAEALPSVLSGLFAVLDRRYEVIVVNDASSDDTATIAQRYPCQLLNHPFNRGKGAAVRTGLMVARGRFIIVMDADNTYPPEAIPEMVQALQEVDFVRCSRSVGASNIPPLNRLGNKLFDLSLRYIHGLEGEDHLTGLYGLRRDALQAMRFTSNGFDLEVEIGIKARAQRLRARSLPIRYNARLGEKKLRPWHDGTRIMRRIFALTLLYNPGQIFVFPAMLIGMLAAALLVGRLLNRSAVSFSTGSEVVTLVLLGVMTWFHFVVFGMVSALYSSHEYDARQNPWLLTLSRQSVRRGAMVGGGILLGMGVALLIATSMMSLTGGYAGTSLLLPGGVLCFAGVQLLLASLFVSLFVDQPESQEPELVLSGSAMRPLTLGERGWPGQQEASLEGLAATNLAVTTMTDADLAASD